MVTTPSLYMAHSPINCTVCMKGGKKRNVTCQCVYRIDVLAVCKAVSDDVSKRHACVYTLNVLGSSFSRDSVCVVRNHEYPTYDLAMDGKGGPGRGRRRMNEINWIVNHQTPITAIPTRYALSSSMRNSNGTVSTRTPIAPRFAHMPRRLLKMSDISPSFFSRSPYSLPSVSPSAARTIGCAAASNGSHAVHLYQGRQQEREAGRRGGWDSDRM